MSALFAGFFTGLSLIVAIGAQNAFVLRQGLTGRFVFPVAAVSALLDAALICIGVGGLGALLETNSMVLEIVRWLGAAYLIWFGLGSLRKAFGSEVMNVSGKGPDTLLKTIAATLTFSLLNPHVYLDTVVFLGSVAAQFTADRWWFALGASLASFGWFFGLAYGAKQFAAVAKNPRFWRVLDSLIALIMFALALSLILMR